MCVRFSGFSGMLINFNQFHEIILCECFVREGLCEKAEEVFEQMQEAGLEPDVYAYNALMETYSLIP